MKSIAGILLFMLLMSCGDVRVETKFDETVDFSEYKSFCWLEGCKYTYLGPEQYLDSTSLEIFAEAITTELAERGIVHDENNPDLLVSFMVIVEEKETTVARLNNNNDYPFWEDFNEDSYEYLKGSLIIDIADSKTSAMVWRSDVIRYMQNIPDITADEIRKGIKLALRDFPPSQEREFSF